MTLAGHCQGSSGVERTQPTDGDLSRYLLQRAPAFILVHSACPAPLCPWRPVMDTVSLKADTYGYGLDGTSPLPAAFGLRPRGRENATRAIRLALDAQSSPWSPSPSGCVDAR